eukprot:scaffold895_cov315-Pinguiococcus_pyrenoidosus.AAC.29
MTGQRRRPRERKTQSRRDQMLGDLVTSEALFPTARRFRAFQGVFVFIKQQGGDGACFQRENYTANAHAKAGLARVREEAEKGTSERCGGKIEEATVLPLLYWPVAQTNCGFKGQRNNQKTIKPIKFGVGTL